jgi:hypothetical protein
VSQPPPEFYQAFPESLKRCRRCQVAVQPTDLTCPECQAPRPALAEFHGEGYEWRSEATWMGYPLVHVAFGLDAEGRTRVAEGIVAVGQRATGALAVGVIARGFVSLGVLSFGVFSFGVVAVGALAAFGCNAVAPFAIGVAAFGYWAGGVSAMGWTILFSVAR